MQLRGYRVLLIEQHPIGTHQMSACGTPLATARAVGAERAIQEVHDALVLHIGGQAIRFPLPDPYVTFDYRAFCAAMLARTDAEVRLARATGADAGVGHDDIAGRNTLVSSSTRPAGVRCTPRTRAPRPCATPATASRPNCQCA